MAFDYERYIRHDTMPHIWCAGCGHGIIMKALIRAIDSLGLDKDKVVIVSGIGCASRLPGYIDCNTLHTTHGRALPFAIGVKMAKPQLEVIVVSGDGDALAIGGNHFIHACRRNINLTLIIFNNYIYGMTGGQFSPTSPLYSFSTTTPYGNPEPEFDAIKLAEGAGATFGARGTTYHAVQIESLIRDGIRHKGFSVIDVLEACPTGFGRRNRFKSVIDMMKWQRDNTLSVKAAQNMTPEQLKGKILIGVLFKKERAEYVEEYQKLMKKAKGIEQ